MPTHFLTLDLSNFTIDPQSHSHTGASQLPPVHHVSRHTPLASILYSQRQRQTDRQTVRTVVSIHASLILNCLRKLACNSYYRSVSDQTRGSSHSWVVKTLTFTQQTWVLVPPWVTVDVSWTKVLLCTRSSTLHPAGHTQAIVNKQRETLKSATIARCCAQNVPYIKLAKVKDLDMAADFNTEQLQWTE